MIGVAVFYRAFLVMTFDEIQAQLLGLRPRLAHAVLLILLAFSIVTSFEAVGKPVGLRLPDFATGDSNVDHQTSSRDHGRRSGHWFGRRRRSGTRNR